MNDTVFCENSELEIKAITDKYYDLFWNDGTNQKQLYITEPGNYFVMATNRCGTDSASVVLD
jgi:hypothetical protein